MNKNDIPNDTLSALKKGMATLTESLPSEGLISEKEIRKAMQTKSAWLNKMVITECFTMPICALVFLGIFHATGMSMWLLATFVFFATLDTILDFRTLKISKKWILNDSMLELSEKLCKQKKERMWQTIIATSLVVPWIIWFVYEWLRHAIPGVTIPEEQFLWIWGIVSGVWLIVAFVIILYIYRRAQRINSEMIRQIGINNEPE